MDKEGVCSPSPNISENSKKVTRVFLAIFFCSKAFLCTWFNLLSISLSFGPGSQCNLFIIATSMLSRFLFYLPWMYMHIYTCFMRSSPQNTILLFSTAPYSKNFQLEQAVSGTLTPHPTASLRKSVVATLTSCIYITCCLVYTAT